MAKGKRGRPPEYDPAIAAAILDALADGRTLNSICRAEGMPAARTVRRWAADPDHEFSPRYARAREIGYHFMADQLIDIGDEVGEDVGSVAKARLRAENRKWLLAKALPKIYGDKVALTDPEGTGPAIIQVLTGVPRA